jgi:F-type H+-transporting ATPase subunit gamma
VKRELDLARHLHSLTTLAHAISSMKSLSAHHFRQMRAELQSARSYRTGIDHLLESTGARLPAGRGAKGILVLGADLGLCGGYHAALVAAATERRRELGPGPTYCLGRRTGRLLVRHGTDVARTYTAPSSVHGVTEALLGLAQEVLTEYVTRDLSSLDVLSACFEGVGSYSPRFTRLLPVDAKASAHAPKTRYTGRERLAEVAVRELLYITMYELLLDALASEHGARLVATQSAEQWLAARIGRLSRELSSIRREASTQEVIEIALGARARRKSPPPEHDRESWPERG